jgi:predicted DNA-binding protein (MmcQ/YjbR family)
VSGNLVSTRGRREVGEEAGVDLKELCAYCRGKKGASEGFPFGAGTLVFKVGGRMFALVGLDARVPAVNLKCDPFTARELREKYTAVRPGYHMDKRHWNTVALDGSVPDEELRWMVDHSHGLVVDGLGRKARAGWG